jgi:hypothetical protein
MMDDVATAYAKVDNKNFKNRIASALGKSPALINIRTTKICGESDTDGAKLGNMKNYANVKFKNGMDDGYLDFGNDPNRAEKYRQTRMHLINAKLHGNANNHVPGTNNLFWGSMNANKAHLKKAEKPNKDALEQIEKNTNGGLFDELTKHNPPIKIFGTDGVVIDYNSKLPKCTFDTDPKAKYPNQNVISKDLWKQHTGLALDYTTEASYYGNSDLRKHFISDIPKEVEATNLAVRLTEPERIAALRKGLKDLEFDFTGSLSEILTSLTTDVLVDRIVKHDFKALLETLNQANMQEVLKELEKRNPGKIQYLSSLLFSGDITKNINDILSNKTMAEIADKIDSDADLNTKTKEVLKDIKKDLLIDMLLKREDETISSLGKYIVTLTYGSTEKIILDNLRRLTYSNKTELLAESDKNYQEIVETAAKELRNMTVSQFKSYGEVIVPAPDNTAWKKFNQLDTNEEKTFQGIKYSNSLHSMKWEPDSMPNVRFTTKKGGF